MPKSCCYGPVSSRRLGRSLGVDIIPFKTCTYDCVYCQLGRTSIHTMERKAYLSASVVLDELSRKIPATEPDMVSFAGSGEPTLNVELGAMLRGIRKMSSVSTAVFTNASLLWLPEVREDLATASMVSPSLDAALAATAECVNRPCAGLDFAKIVGGLEAFCREYRGRIWLEVLLCDGVNDSPADIEATAAIIRRLENIERVQLNSVSRPPADRAIKPVSRERLEAIAACLPGNVEIVASYPKAKEVLPGKTATEEEVLAVIACHPCTADAVAAGLGIALADAERLCTGLLAQGKVRAEQRAEGLFYSADLQS